MATPYQNIAKKALINWNGLSEEDANKKIENESVLELENQVYAMGSIKYAVAGISKQINLTDNETVRFFNAVINGPENDEIFAYVRTKMTNFSDKQELDVLSTIHDGWVKDNSSDKTFQKKVNREQLRQYAPLDLIGWNEVKSDLLFLNPILESVGVSVNENNLEQEYYERVKDYLNDKKIKGEDDLVNLVSQGRKYYPALSEDLENKLNPLSNDVANQIMQNWINKNPKISNMLENDKVSSRSMR